MEISMSNSKLEAFNSDRQNRSKEQIPDTKIFKPNYLLVDMGMKIWKQKQHHPICYKLLKKYIKILVCVPICYVNNSTNKQKNVVKLHDQAQTLHIKSISYVQTGKRENVDHTVPIHNGRGNDNIWNVKVWSTLHIFFFPVKNSPLGPPKCNLHASYLPSHSSWEGHRSLTGGSRGVRSNRGSKWILKIEFPCVWM